MPWCGKWGTSDGLGEILAKVLTIHRAGFDPRSSPTNRGRSPTPLSPDLNRDRDPRSYVSRGFNLTEGP